MSTLPYALLRVYADGSEEPVSDHATFGDGWSAGQHAVHEDRDNAYALYRDGRRIARFAFVRLIVSQSASGLPTLLGPVA